MEIIFKNRSFFVFSLIAEGRKKMKNIQNFEDYQGLLDIMAEIRKEK